MHSNINMSIKIIDNVTESFRNLIEAIVIIQQVAKVNELEEKMTSNEDINLMANDFQNMCGYSEEDALRAAQNVRLYDFDAMQVS